MNAIDPLLIGVIVGMVIILVIRQPSTTVIMPNDGLRPASGGGCLRTGALLVAGTLALLALLTLGVTPH